MRVSTRYRCWQSSAPNIAMTLPLQRLGEATSLLDGGRGRLRNREEERRALTGLALGPDAPAVPLDDALHGREAHARPRVTDDVRAARSPLSRAPAGR